MSDGDRFVDLIREGVDCVLRVGALQDSDMIARRLAMLDEVTMASRDYIEARGMPAHPSELQRGHCVVGFHSSATGGVLPLEFTMRASCRKSRCRRSWPLPEPTATMPPSLAWA